MAVPGGSSLLTELGKDSGTCFLPVPSLLLAAGTEVERLYYKRNSWGVLCGGWGGVCRKTCLGSKAESSHPDLVSELDPCCFWRTDPKPIYFLKELILI